MSKFCPKCGVQLDDNATFCTSCGESLNPQPQNTPNAPKKESKFNKEKIMQLPLVAKALSLPRKKLLIYGGIGLAAIVAIIVILCLIFPSPKMLARRYMNGYIKGNAKQVVNCMPSFYFEDNDEKKEFIEDLQDRYDDMELDEYDSIKFEIKEVNKLSKNQRDRLESILENYEDIYDGFDADSINVKTAKIVDVKLTIEDGGDTRRTNMSLVVVKYKGMWKILNVNLSNN